MSGVGEGVWVHQGGNRGNVWDGLLKWTCRSVSLNERERQPGDDQKGLGFSGRASLQLCSRLGV